MSIAKYTYWYFQKQLDKEVCEKILSIGKNKLKNFGEKGKEKGLKIGRKCDICWLNVNEESSQTVIKNLKDIFPEKSEFEK